MGGEGASARSPALKGGRHQLEGLFFFFALFFFLAGFLVLAFFLVEDEDFFLLDVSTFFLPEDSDFFFELVFFLPEVTLSVPLSEALTVFFDVDFFFAVLAPPPGLARQWALTSVPFLVL